MSATEQPTAREQLKDYPLTTVSLAFLTGFATSSGLASAGVTALSVATRNPTVRRVAVVAWPIVRANLSNHVKDSTKSFVRDAFRRASASQKP